MDFEPHDFQAFVSSRRSTRDFLSTPVSDEIIAEIIADGLTSPSWSNTRPIRVAVAKGDVRDRLSKEFLSRWEEIKGARGSIFGKIKSVLKRKGLPTSNWIITRPYHKDLIERAKNQGRDFFSHIGVERDDKKSRDESWARNYDFFGAPVELFIFTHKSLGKYSASDAGLFMQNLILSAHSKGLGTCPQGAVAIWEDAVRKEFDISKNYSLLCGICLGYPSDEKINSFEANRPKTSEIILPKKH